MLRNILRLELLFQLRLRLYFRKLSYANQRPTQPSSDNNYWNRVIIYLTLIFIKPLQQNFTELFLPSSRV